jgi:ferredoxin-NADP reductase/nitrite reductase/ring-hydroxylating ferredoxin subunit
MMTDSQTVANKKDLREGGLLRVELKGRPIVLSMVKGRIYAMDATCTHQGGPLDEGKLEEYSLTCPWHNAVFDVRNGNVSDKTAWATDLNSYPVHVDQATGDILIELHPAQRESQNIEEPLQQKRTEEKMSDNEIETMEEVRKFYEEEEHKASEKLSLKLLGKDKLEGSDIMTFNFSRGGLDYAAGQFAYFRLEGVSGDPKGPIRHFTIASSPTEENHILLSTRIRDTPYKQKLAALAVGTNVVTWGPQGEFTLHADRPAVFLSGGIGVTPFRSMVKYATDKALPTQIVMFDSNRNIENILYKNEFDKWAKENRNLRIIYTITDEDKSGEWQGESGRIDKNMLRRQLSEKQIAESVYYVCGPPGMLKAMQGILSEMQIPKDRIKVEEFTGY